MQRMLALPVGQEATPTAPPGEPVAHPAEPLPAPRVATMPARQERANPAKAAAPAKPALPPAAAGPRTAPAKDKAPTRPEASAGATAAKAAQETAAGPGPLGPEIFASLQAGPALFAPRPAATPRRPGARRPLLPRGWLLGSLLWANRAFDRGTEYLGAPGRWLRGLRGRTVLGWLGVALLLGALTWQVLAWLGWGW
jgi:hypothetical protein